MSEFRVPEPDLQITFYHRLQDVRRTYLLEALLSTVANLEIVRIDRELVELVSVAGLQKVAGWGLRGEIVFPMPYVLTERPALPGYYRLLLGFSQKKFYGRDYGFARFKPMEEGRRLSQSNASRLLGFCQMLCDSAERLVKGVGELSHESVHELTLLTLGPQLRGGALNVLGDRATRRVFHLISTILSPAVVTAGERALELENAAGRRVRVEFASDPDICIREELPSGRSRNLVAIEIKGGRDNSNIHNRIGEAEKSHQKARQEGYVECWTMVGVTELNMGIAQQESPSTDRFYHIDRITDESSHEWEDFRENLLSRVGMSG